MRRQGTYDAVLAACVDRPLAKVEAKVLDALRLGTHQLLAMRVPAHAAISTTVDLVALRGRPGAGRVRQRRAAQGLRATTSTAGSPRLARTPAQDPVGYLGVAHSHPRWVVEVLTRGRSATTSSTRCWRPTTRRRGSRWSPGPGRATVDELPRRADRATRRTASELEGGDPGAVPAVAEGRAGVQDEGSQLVALALAAAAVDGRDERWLDLCAGPGGKAALLAALAAGAGRAAARRRAAAAPGRAWSRARCAGADGVLGRGHRRRHPPGLAGRVPSTGCWSTRPAPGWARCAAGPRPAGGAARPTSTTWCRCSGRCSTRRSTPCDPAAWCSTRPARRCSRRPPAWSRRCSPPATTSRLERRRGPARRRTRLRRAAARHRPAVAAPARHRRDVRGAAAPARVAVDRRARRSPTSSPTTSTTWPRRSRTGPSRGRRSRSTPCKPRPGSATCWSPGSTPPWPGTSPCTGGRSYPSYAAAGIPEVRDFNVLAAFQRRGIGTALMDAAEERVAAGRPPRGRDRRRALRRGRVRLRLGPADVRQAGLRPRRRRDDHRRRACRAGEHVHARRRTRC